MKATDFYAALAGHSSGRFSEGFSLRRSQVAASQIAAASARSFLCRLTYGFT